jgi:archaellum component FlaC
MNIDERLERLTERHEALTQTVELMAARMEDRDKRLDGVLTQMAEGINRLLHVAEIHEQRIEDLEGRS